ncbi:hypothetical protein AAHR76_001661 [Yersinia enterocolitica]|nr:hypothetical protein [Yersinia enterocolitica]
MSIRDKNRAFIMKFLEDGEGGGVDDALFWFRGRSVVGVENALDLVTEDYKIHGMDRKAVCNNIHAYEIKTEPEKEN